MAKNNVTLFLQFINKHVFLHTILHGVLTYDRGQGYIKL